MAVKWDWMARLGTLNDQQKDPTKPILKGKSTLQADAEKDALEKKAEGVWKDRIWELDKGVCRMCKRKVERGGKKRPLRGEVHHVAGRAIPLIKWDVRNGILLCAECHEKITGRIDEKWVIVAAAGKGTYEVMVKGGMQTFTNARQKVTFERAA